MFIFMALNFSSPLVLMRRRKCSGCWVYLDFGFLSLFLLKNNHLWFHFRAKPNLTMNLQNILKNEKEDCFSTPSILIIYTWFCEAHCSELVPGPKHQYLQTDNRMSCRNISILFTHIKKTCLTCNMSSMYT